ncbi:hypothetical protein [Lysobacter sp. Root690]|uniref:hypothetical protein n=1 Tax=Lysobacter sp. Root690 TaxID=1736588 RepID=UPI000A792D49|nr:hypothetical protein [Lysobacter sp. Root690]
MARLGLSKQNLISRGAARFNDLVYLALQDKKLQRNGTVHTRLGSLDEGEIANVKDLAWHAVGMCVAKLPSEKLVVVAGDGTVFTYVGGQEGSEKIAGAFDLRGCATVDGYAYAFGMNRTVFRRGHERRWTAMHAPGVEADNEVAGFEAIDGFGANDLYAAGWGGEVWHWRGDAWSRCETRVDIVLSGICCGGDGLVYACGQSGTLLRGRGREWEALNTEGLTDDFWDVRWYKGRVYVASTSSLYALYGDALVPVEFGADAPESCYKLTDAEDVLWSVGQRNLFSFDGAVWSRWE